MHCYYYHQSSQQSEEKKGENGLSGDLDEFLQDGSDGGAEGESIITEAYDVTRSSGDAEEGGGALFFERGGDLLGRHLELHLQIHQVFV